MDSFRLTLPKVQSTVAAYVNLLELLAADDALAAKFKAMKKTLPDTNGRDTLGLTVQKMAGVDARIPTAFAKAGITPKEASMTMECLVGVIFGSSMLEATKTAPKNLPPFVAENLAFYDKNKAEVLASFKRLQSVSEKAKDSLEDDEEREEQDSEQP